MPEVWNRPCEGCPYERMEDGMLCCCWDSDNIVPISKVEDCPMNEETD